MAESKINKAFGPTREIFKSEGPPFWKYRTGILGVKKAFEQRCSFIPASVLTMSKQEVTVSVMQRIIIKFLAQKIVKSED